MKKQVVDDVKRISDSYNKLDTQPIQSATMEFVPVEEYKNSMIQFGHLSDTDVCIVNCEALGVPEMVCEGEIAEFIIVTKDQNNYICYKGESQVVIEAQSSRGDITAIEVNDNEDGSYSASFVASQVGEVKLSVTIKGRQIRGSPFSVKVHVKYTKISKPSKTIHAGGKMGKPWGIAFGRDGIWAVTDDSNHCVWIFDREDQLITKFGSLGRSNGNFNRPLGVAFDTNNHLYVTEIVNHRVQSFDIHGAYLFKFSNKGSSVGRLKHPLGIVVHDDNLYVAEWGNNCISVFQLEGQFIHVIGSGYLRNPRYIAVSNNNQLLVSNSDHHCISVFTLDGNYVGKIGTQGTGGGEFRNPSGICTDICGFTLVADDDNRFISIFDNDGIFVHCFGRGFFSSPHGVAVNPAGDIYVSDGKNRRIQIFSTYLATAQCSLKQ